MRVYQAKDFLETTEGLVFAVVAEGEELGRVRCVLRYQHQAGGWRKLSTQQANQFLQQRHPDYVFYAPSMEAQVHGVRPEQVVRHLSPQQMLQRYLHQAPTDAVLADLQALCALLQAQGATVGGIRCDGFFATGRSGAASDIDLVCYRREVFHETRRCIQTLTTQNQLQRLEDADWLEAYQRRGCDFPFDDYVWHERRKYNKGLIHHRKFDLSLVIPGQNQLTPCVRKCGTATLQAYITEDAFSFDYPARWSIDAGDVQDLVCFTATYTGQAQKGELVEVTGQLEEDASGSRRIVVGSDREAVGEFIRVIR